MEGFTFDIVQTVITGLFINDDIVNAVLFSAGEVFVEEGHSFVNFNEAKDAGGGDGDADKVEDDEDRDASFVAERFEEVENKDKS